MKKISWFTPPTHDASGDLWNSMGFNNAAVSIIKALNEKDCAVFYNRNNVPFHVNFCQPHYYQLNNDYKVGYTPWESTNIPNSWLYNMSLCDEIWATSEFVKQVYLDKKVHNNIHVIPHGIDSDYSIIDREITHSFYFLHVGGDSKRKNAQLAIDAFLECFDGQDEYKLILKYNNYIHAEVYMENRFVHPSNHPQIICIPNQLSTEQMIKLYHKCHCLVYPTSGEGFGMIPFETICTGMPSIVTNLTGTADFAKYSIPLEAYWGDADWNSHLYSCDTGMWAIPDFEQLCDLMNHVVNEYDDFKKYTIQSAKILHEEMSWSSIADKILSRLDVYEKI